MDVGTEGDRLESERLMGEPSDGDRFLGRPRSMIEADDSDSCLRWPFCEGVRANARCDCERLIGASDWPLAWHI